MNKLIFLDMRIAILESSNANEEAFGRKNNQPICFFTPKYNIFPFYFLFTLFYV